MRGPEGGDRRGKALHLSVVVTSYRRTRFLSDALDSVYRQTLPAEAFDITLITDSPDFPLPGAPVGLSVNVLTETEPMLGPWISRVARSAKGDVLVFLDDDDLFSIDKLSKVLERFQSDPRLGYYHNMLLPFSGAPDSVISPTRRPPRTLVLSPAERGPGLIEQLWREGAAFNQSSISVRRELVLAFADDLNRLRDGFTTFLFFAALLSECSVRSDGEPLTRYRLRVERESPAARAHRLAEVRRADSRLILDLVAQATRGPLCVRPLLSIYARSELLLALQRLGGPGQISRKLWNFVRTSTLGELWSNRYLLKEIFHQRPIRGSTR